MSSKPQKIRVSDADDFDSLQKSDRIPAAHIQQQRAGRQAANQEAVNKIEKLFYAVEDKIKKSDHAGMTGETL